MWTICLLPFFWLLRLTWLTCIENISVTDGLGANPIEFVHDYLGLWALKFLIITLSIKPISFLFHASFLNQFRRIFGLFTFFYSVLHTAAYIALEQNFELASIWEDVVNRPHITLGVIGFLALIPLAITSTSWGKQNLGNTNWKNLHRLVYVAGTAGCLHFILIRKGIQVEPIAYTVVFVCFLIGQFVFSFLRRKKIVDCASSKKPLTIKYR